MVGQERLLTPRFLLVTCSGLAYFLSLGMLLPVLPLYVQNRLGGDNAEVGIAVGAFAVGAVLLRPSVGRLGDRFGRRVLMLGGAITVAVSIACYLVATSLLPLLVARVFTGFGEAAFFVGAGTMITDLAPADRRGEAISYWSVAVYGGLSFGPALGELVLNGRSYSRVWIVAAVFACIAAVLAVGTKESAQFLHQDAPQSPLLHRAALAPGTVLFLGLIGLAGYTAFVPLYVRHIGLHSSKLVFLVYGCLILVVRIVGARLPDRLGPVRAGTGALGFGGTGLLIVSLWPHVAGLYVGTAVFAVGMSLLYPALLTLALQGVDDRERASVVGTFSTFFDLSQGLGALILGGVAQAGGYGATFAAGAIAAYIGLVLLRCGVDPRTRRVPAVVHADAELAEPNF
jgi:MFS family permease